MEKEQIEQVTNVEEAGVGSTTETVNNDNGANGVQTPTFDEMLSANPEYQAEFDRRMTKGNKTAVDNAKKQWQQQADDEADEAEKLSKMNDQQRAQYQFNKQRKEFEAEKTAFKREKLKLAAGDELVKRGYSAALAAFVMGEDAQSTTANIDKLDGLLQEAISNKTKEAMRGNPPKSNPPKSSADNQEDLFLKGFNSK